ncbi:MAG: hypothetical protein EHM48_01525 [Planctomycetaceae bacterium]|nr:MAG: hypothetical protein EHM48_01525 [Planctomycetaceae bacterium]
MNFKLYKGWVIVVVCGAILLAGAVLVFMNWGDTCKPHVFTKTVDDVSIGLLMLLSAVGGAVMHYAAKFFWSGVKTLRAGLAKRKYETLVENQNKQEKQTPPV